ncbi:MAG: chromate transporter [Butyrivibrio sp.]|nr:chromate transporter [Butyrivibrio sp.]
MKNNKLVVLFFETLKISAFTFGGGFVIIPLLQRKFVENLKWIDEEGMLDMTAIAQSTPGPVAVNVAILAGYHVAGIPGAAISVLGTIIPPLFIISLISMFYNTFRNNIYVNIAMAGMLCGVAAVILDVVISMLGLLFKGKDKTIAGRIISLAMLVAAFVANRFLKINIIFIILASGVIGLMMYLFGNRKDRRKGEDNEDIT